VKLDLNKQKEVEIAEFYIECDLVLPLSVSNILSFLLHNPIAA